MSKAGQIGKAGGRFDLVGRFDFALRGVTGDMRWSMTFGKMWGS